MNTFKQFLEAQEAPKINQTAVRFFGEIARDIAKKYEGKLKNPKAHAGFDDYWLMNLSFKCDDSLNRTSTLHDLADGDEELNKKIKARAEKATAAVSKTFRDMVVEVVMEAVEKFGKPDKLVCTYSTPQGVYTKTLAHADHIAANAENFIMFDSTRSANGRAHIQFVLEKPASRW